MKYIKNGDKLEYLIKTLSRTKRKDYENYIVNRFYNRLNDLDIKPVTQKYVKSEKNDKKYYLIDLYFPQFKIGIECDEPYHEKQKDKDELRASEIVNRIDGYKQRRIKVKNKSLDEINEEIDTYIKEIKEEKIRQEHNNVFKPWKIFTAEEYFKDKNKITIDDDYEFKTISEACNTILKTNYKAMRKCFFGAHNKEGYLMWFPHLAGKSSIKNGWINTLSEDGKRIVEYNEKQNNDDSTNKNKFNKYLNTKRIVLMKIKNNVTEKENYKFVGVFEVEKYNNREITYKKISDEFEF